MKDLSIHSAKVKTYKQNSKARGHYVTTRGVSEAIYKCGKCPKALYHTSTIVNHMLAKCGYTKPEALKICHEQDEMMSANSLQNRITEMGEYVILIILSDLMIS